MFTKPLYQRLASLVGARLNCIAKGNDAYLATHTERIEALVKEHMPSGSGIDSGTKLDLDESTSEKLVFTFGFHHMNDAGVYDGWTDHKAIVTASLQFGFSLRITGRDRNGIKDYLHETFGVSLETQVES